MEDFPDTAAANPDVLFKYPIHWAGGSRNKLGNTCPVDNFFAILEVAACNSNPALLGFLKNSADEAESTLGRVLDLMYKGRINDGKDEWVSFLLQKGTPLVRKPGNVIDMFGGQLNLFLSLFCNSFSLRCVSECSNGPEVCNRFRWTVQTSKLIRISSPLNRPGNDIQTQIDKFVVEKSVSPCSYSLQPNVGEKVLKECSRIIELTDEDNRPIFERVCNGQRMVCEKAWRPECWMIPFNVEKLHYLEVFDLQDVITVNSKLYYLRGVTVSEGGHFTAYVRKGKCWFYYCGMMEAAGRKIGVPQSTGEPKIAIYTL